mmetsp:Transcript_29512/g.68050  ORF Transcript_29512/g.68050 Transcript_29512/m.68050 type:complete len:351 (-) Transcript_29512:105-1157(-)
MQPWKETPLETFQADVEQILMQRAKETAREIRTELAKSKARTQIPGLPGTSATRSSVLSTWSKGFYDAQKLAACDHAEFSPVKTRSVAGTTALPDETTGLSYRTILRNAFKLKDIAQSLRDEAHERAAAEAAVADKKPAKRPTADVNSIMKAITQIGDRRKTILVEQAQEPSDAASQPRKSVKKKSECKTAAGTENGQGRSPVVNPKLQQAINEAAQEEMVNNTRGRLGRPDLKREYSVGQTSVVQPAFQVDGMDSSASPQSHYDVMVPPPSPVHPAAKQQQPLSSRAFMEAWERREHGSPRSAQAERLAAQTADLHRTLAEITANLEKAQVIGRGRPCGADVPNGNQET